MVDDSALPLEGLYLHLVRAGFPISARDYQDALAALRAGYGIGGRERLHWLCRTLWARGDEEIVRLEALFATFPQPSAQDVRELAGRPAAPASGDLPGATRADARARRAADGADEGEPLPGLGFGAPEAQGAGGLPGVQYHRPPARHYVMEPRPPVSTRGLIVAWRRFRRSQRTGARTELDIDATVDAQCRLGAMLAPVYVAPRRNQARLLVLVDASPSMAAWHGLHRALAASLAQGTLAHAPLLFFDNDPRDGLYEQESLAGWIALDDAFRRHPDCAVLVIGDAGAARGRLDRDRVEGTGDFLARIRAQGLPVAWLNPMPRARWRGTSAQRTADRAPVSMQPFTEDGLTRAIDVLRGRRTG
jgi:uncharacterized protein with von Willebrand factor type A (vWA) domain